MRWIQFITYVLVICVAATTVSADTSPWKRESEIGLLMTSGNSETESLNAKLRINYEPGKWFNNAKVEALYSAEESQKDDGTSDKEKSAEKYLVSDKIGYNINEANYIFAIASYDYDFFSGYYYQTVVSPGYGRRIVKTNALLLEVELGPGYRFSSVREAGDGDDEDELILRASGLFNYKLNDTSSFQQDVSVESGEENTVTKSVSAIKALIIGALAMKASFTVKHNSNPPDKESDPVEKTDTETALTLVYSF